MEDRSCGSALVPEHGARGFEIEPAGSPRSSSASSVRPVPGKLTIRFWRANVAAPARRRRACRPPVPAAEGVGYSAVNSGAARARFALTTIAELRRLLLLARQRSLNGQLRNPLVEVDRQW